MDFDQKSSFNSKQIFECSSNVPQFYVSIGKKDWMHNHCYFNFWQGISTEILRKEKKIVLLLNSTYWFVHSTATTKHKNGSEMGWGGRQNERDNVYICPISCHCAKHYDKLTIECINFRTMANEIVHCFLERNKWFSLKNEQNIFLAQAFSIDYVLVYWLKHMNSLSKI